MILEIPSLNLNVEESQLLFFVLPERVRFIICPLGMYQIEDCFGRNEYHCVYGRN
jgi:hypothetical protein